MKNSANNKVLLLVRHDDASRYVVLSWLKIGFIIIARLNLKVQTLLTFC